MRRRVTLDVLTALAYVVAVALYLGTPVAGAAPAKPLDDNLAALWTRVLETPNAQNPFGNPGGPPFDCFDLGGTVAPFAPGGVKSCTVEPGTKIFVASTVECSTFEGNGTTEKELRQCAFKTLNKTFPKVPTVTVDGKSVPVTEVETRLLNITLPEGNIFASTDGPAGGTKVCPWGAAGSRSYSR